MPATIATALTDSAIKRHAQNPDIKQINDPRHPLRLRYHGSRASASWHLVQYQGGRATWTKLGNWPGLTAKALLDKLPTILAERATDPDAVVAANDWHTLGDLLAWYGDRVAADRHLSKSRRDAISSAIKCHLMPLAGSLPLDDLSATVLDEQLVWPLMADYRKSSVRAWLYVLKSATARAAKLKHLAADPLAAVTFSDFTQTALPVKAGKIRPTAAAALIQGLANIPPRNRLLVLLMLCFGTRIGETRKARWEHFEPGVWFIPADNTKTGVAHELPITAPVQQLLDVYRRRSSSVWVFPSPAKGCIGATTASNWVNAVSGGQWSAHDLRKLARTRWTDQGTDYMVGELLLNHAMTKLDKAYIHTHAWQQKQKALETYHEWLMDQGLNDLLGKMEARQTAKT